MGSITTEIKLENDKVTCLGRIIVKSIPNKSVGLIKLIQDVNAKDEIIGDHQLACIYTEECDIENNEYVIFNLTKPGNITIAENITEINPYASNISSIIPPQTLDLNDCNTMSLINGCINLENGFFLHDGGNHVDGHITPLGFGPDESESSNQKIAQSQEPDPQSSNTSLVKKHITLYFGKFSKGLTLDGHSHPSDHNDHIDNVVYRKKLGSRTNVSIFTLFPVWIRKNEDGQIIVLDKLDFINPDFEINNIEDFRQYYYVEFFKHDENVEKEEQVPFYAINPKIYF